MRRTGFAVGVLAILLLLTLFTLPNAQAAMFWKEFGPNNVYHYPDFSQKQDNWGTGAAGPGIAGWKWTYCGPTAEADSLWYFDHLAQFQATGAVADWSKGAGYVVPLNNDPVWLINKLASYFHCDGQLDPGLQQSTHGVGYTGTYVDDMETGITQYLQAYAQSSLGLYEHTIVKPTFNQIVTEVQACQDVTLLVGFYQFGNDGFWHRIGGHYLTVAGIDSASNPNQVSVCDPCLNNAEAAGAGRVLGLSHAHGIPDTAHNDGQSASHDTYNIVMGAGLQTSNGLWEISGYPFTSEIMTNFQEQNPRLDSLNTLLPIGSSPPVGTMATEVEYAVIVSPEPGTLILLGTGLVGLFGLIRRRRLS